MTETTSGIFLGDASPAAPTVTADSFLTLHYRIILSESDEVMASTFEEKPATLQMGQGQMAEGLEACLLGMQAGQRKIYELPPLQAYGERQASLFQRVSKKTLAEHAEADTSFEVGDFVEFPAPNGGKFAGTVAQIEDEAVVFDFNHPLAGTALRFEVQIIGVL